MAGTGSLKSDPLFVGLTRPPMFFGVSYMFAMMNGMASMMYYIATTDFKFIIILIGVHMIAYVICFKEPLFLELFLIKSQKCSVCKNRFYYGANSYDVY